MYDGMRKIKAKKTLMAVNTYLHVCGDWGHSRLNNVNGYKQMFTCTWELERLKLKQR